MSPRLLYIGYVWPEYTASAAGVRNWSIVESLLAAGWKIRYQSHAKPNDFTARLEALGVETACIAANDPAFDASVRDFSPDFALFDRFVTEEQFSWRVREVCPDALRILDTQDLHFLRKAREAA